MVALGTPLMTAAAAQSLAVVLRDTTNVVHPLEFFAGRTNLPDDGNLTRLINEIRDYKIEPHQPMEFRTTDNSSIVARDLQSLFGLEWLNDNVINLALSAYAQHCGAACLIGRFPSRPGSLHPFVYAGSYFVIKLCGTSLNEFHPEAASRLFNPEKASSPRIIQQLFDNNIWIIPVNVTETHFHVEVFYLKERLAETWDSYGTGVPNPRGSLME
ncbi:hypothetical protein T484DRAFT_2933118 [Baffinella frigidus]|nr:hypothetical protein T484DRAFT_2933118 [Cryptophyta sp. CCMP2293]